MSIEFIVFSYSACSSYSAMPCFIPVVDDLGFLFVSVLLQACQFCWFLFHSFFVIFLFSIPLISVLIIISFLLYPLCLFFCFFWFLEVGIQIINLRPCSLLWCEHFNAIKMFSFFFSCSWCITFLFLFISLCLFFFFFLFFFLCVFKILFLFGPWFIWKYIVECRSVRMFLCCTFVIDLLSDSIVIGEHTLISVLFKLLMFVLWPRSCPRNCPVLRTCPRCLKRNVYCVDKGYVACECQLDPVGWWCSGFLVSFSYMYIYSIISYVSLSFTSEMFDGRDVQVLEYNRICLFFLLAFPIFVSSFCNSGAYTFGHSI